jgi:hypothetical protein
MVDNFKVGDAYFMPELGRWFRLTLYDKNLDVWRTTGDRTYIYPEELQRLKWFSYQLIKVEDEKHLLALQLKFNK